MITALSLLLIFLAGITVLTSEIGWTNITLSKRNAVVFENKNKAYGAYSIRTTYNDHLLIALGIMLLIVMAFISGNLIWKNLFVETKNPEIKADSPTWIDVPFLEIPPVDAPLAAAKPAANPVSTVFSTPLVIDQFKPDIPPSQDDLDRKTPGATDSPGAPGGFNGPGTTSQGTLISSTGVIEVAEVSPSFPLGYDALMNYLAKNIRYPDQEKDSGIQGTVYLSFVVSSSGEITDVKEIRGVRGGPNLSKEAMRVIRLMPRWKPGLMQGQPVNVRFNLPVKFVLH